MWVRRLVVFFGALFLYFICLDRGASLWDCPEYILIAWRMEIGHPPGNPTWQLIANVVSHLGGSAQHAAIIINAMSAVAMAVAATLLADIIFMLLRVSLMRGGARFFKWANICAVCGALCYAWCDSAIFSAVEAEVYALSAMFTALMLWLALRWGAARRRGDIAHGRRIIIFMAYLAGLGVGVHELNFLILPAVALIFWYGIRKYPRPAGDRKLLQGLPTMMWSCLLFVVGTTTYLILPIRAAANPPINQGDPSNWERFKSYYNRDQYGSKPFIYGHTPYSAPLLLEEYDTLTGRYSYNKYYITENSRGIKQYVFPRELDMWFPRMTSRDTADIRFYEMWAGMTKENMVKVEASVAADSAGNHVGKVDPLTGERVKTESWRPTYIQQARYMLGYQLGYMYFRYLLWNFGGRQNNIHSLGGPHTGNFITGIPAADDAMLGPQTRLAPSLRESNRGYNRYFMIPFLIGILGCWALIIAGRDGRRVCAVIATFFIFTGPLIVIYLNQDPGEPRERDYSFLGSYMAYAAWIGCGLAAIVRAMLRLQASGWRRKALRYAAGGLCVAIPLQMLSQTYDDHNRTHDPGASEVAVKIFSTVEPGSILLANGDNAIFPLWYAQEVLGMRRDVSIVAIPYLSLDWYRRQLPRLGEGAPGVIVTDTVPPGPGSISDRAINDIVELNPDRAVYRTNTKGTGADRIN